MVDTCSCESDTPTKHVETLRLGKDVGSVLLDYGWTTLALSWFETTKTILPVVMPVAVSLTMSLGFIVATAGVSMLPPLV